ncbi:MAG: helix-turn-helix domain-containing protein [Fimbriimonas sp.]
MPKAEWAGFPEDGITKAAVGMRVRQLRETRGMTIRDLAGRAGISKTTLLRLEQGLPVTLSVLIKVCDVLDTIPPNLWIPNEVWDRPYQIHRQDKGEWRLAFNRRKRRSKLPNFTVVNDPDERSRLGKLGFVTGFFQSHACALPQGQIQAGLVELYGLHDEARRRFTHAGEEYVLCLKGQVRMTVDGHALVLEPGDAVTFWSKRFHTYESLLDPELGESSLILMVWIEGPEEPSSEAAVEAATESA